MLQKCAHSHSWRSTPKHRTRLEDAAWHKTLANSRVMRRVARSLVQPRTCSHPSCRCIFLLRTRVVSRCYKRPPPSLTTVVVETWRVKLRAGPLHHIEVGRYKMENVVRDVSFCNNGMSFCKMMGLGSWGGKQQKCESGLIVSLGTEGRLSISETSAGGERQCPIRRGVSAAECQGII